ncbi:MAG: DUF368 domain-containing protein [Spirochaetota bacterium]
MNLQQSRKTALLNVFRGMGIGIANVIPGVSGGTIAAITGIYDNLVYCLGNFFKAGWRRSLAYLLPIVIGTLGGFFAFAGLVDIALELHAEQTLFFFIGLILGSIPYLIKRAGELEFRARYLIPFVIALGLIVWMGLAERPPAGDPISTIRGINALIVIGGGALGSIAMVVPGLSGSFLLLLVGFYSTMTNAVRTLNAPVLALFFIGTLAGLVIASKVVSWLLRNFHASSYYAIVGLVLGSVVGVWPGWSGGIEGLLSVGAGLIGLCLSLLLGTDVKERIRARQAKRGADDPQTLSRSGKEGAADG